MIALDNRFNLIKDTCLRTELSTYDPYDLWKSRIGYRAKDFYNRHRLAGLPSAAALTMYDRYVNNRLRLFYEKQEYPIVRALAAQALLLLDTLGTDSSLRAGARLHLKWLSENSCSGYHGPCWGLGFPYAVDRDLHYGRNTPLTTMTPYALEAFVMYMRATGEQEPWLSTIMGIYEFFEQDVPVLEETDDYLVTAYSTLPDRKVVNAVSYVMYSYSLLLPYLDQSHSERTKDKIQKLYNYVRSCQGADGSWPYSTQPPSFIDCFHSCFVLKNILKTARTVDLSGWSEVVVKGYEYLKRDLWVPSKGLVRRFAKANKPGMVRYDLYDNAEMLNVACMMRDFQLAETLVANIRAAFVHDGRIYSHIDWLGFRYGEGMLRWAVMPYCYALAACAATKP